MSTPQPIIKKNNQECQPSNNQFFQNISKISDVSVPSSKEVIKNQFEINDNNIFINGSPPLNSTVKSHPLKSSEIVRFRRNKLERKNDEEFKT